LVVIVFGAFSETKPAAKVEFERLREQRGSIRKDHGMLSMASMAATSIPAL